METQQDKELWKIAKKRVGFRRHLATYIIINGMFWIIWFLTPNDSDKSEFPWPVWPMLGWGIGLAFDFMGTYIYTKQDSIKKEYEKLKGRI